MLTMQEAVLLRVFLGEDDTVDGKPAYRAIIEAAQREELAGGTVLHAPMGFGGSRTMRSGLNPDAGARMPVVVEIIDHPDRIDSFLAILETMVDSGMVTMELVKARFFTAPPAQSKIA